MRTTHREAVTSNSTQRRVTGLQARVEAPKRFQFLRRMHLTRLGVSTVREHAA